jgi:predicted DNA-binding protein (MmcQ/YjbR family)
MDLELLRTYLLDKAGARESAPFDPHTVVFHVGDQIFALISRQSAPLHLSLRCEPDRAELLRALYPSVRPGAYMNRRHWNTLTLDGTITVEVLCRMIDTSYRLALIAGGTPDRLPATFEEDIAHDATN